MRQLSFDDIDDNKKSWEELSDMGRWFLQGIHPESPPPPKQPSPYFKLLRAWKREQEERFAPAKKLGER